jgi:cell wall-active antibiotic response 4TMS protein YvqF
MYRTRGLLFPLVLIAIGVIVLLVNTGVLSQDALQRLGDLWPLLLVILGLQLILNHTLPRQQATLVGLAVTVVIVIAAVLYATLAPATSLGARSADVSERLGGLTAATLDTNYNGATVEVQAGSLDNLLYKAHVDYPGGENPPTFSLDHETGTLAIRESNGFSPFHLFGSNRRHILLTLTDQIPWTIKIGGGAADVSFELRHLQLSKVEISGGASRVDAQLPAPKGTVAVIVDGGASDLTLRAPAETEWRVSVSGGASAITINHSTTASLGGDFQQQSPGYNSAGNRYDIQISGGASHLDFRTG